jgi:tRNA modification GTPase
VLEQTVGVQLWVSATTGLGLSGLRSHLRSRGGLMGQSETVWGARRRHLDALEKTQSDICLGQDHLRESELELLAERLRLAQGHLSGLTGDFHSDDLLGVIFGSFCIGK